MLPYLVDVPVCINIWTRPELQMKTFASVKQARPSVIFLISDGPRNETEKNKIQESRKIVENIDWECTVHKLYFEENQGMYAIIKKEFEFVFERVDRCIFLEDDILPSVSFFGFCAELLEKYKDDYRITAINGFNELGEYTRREEDYFFTLGNCISGFALWKRTYDLFDMECFESKELSKALADSVKYNRRDKVSKGVFNLYCNYRKNPLYMNHPPAVEFFRSFINVSQNQLDIVPSKNMITNLGSIEGTHVGNYKLMPKRIQNLFDKRHYELTLPLKHPKYMVRDYYYESRVFPSKMRLFLERIEVYAKNIIYLSPKDLIKKIKRKIHNKKEIER